MSSISSIPSALISQAAHGVTGGCRRGNPAQQQTSSAGIASLSSLLSAMPSASSTSISTASSLLSSLPGFSSPAGSTSIVV